MSVTATPYGQAGVNLASGLLVLSSDTLKVALCTSSYTPNRDTHAVFSDVTNEVTGTGYTAGGQALASVTVNYDATNHKTVLNSANPSWPGSTITARIAVIYDSTTSKLLCWIDFGADRSSSAGPFDLDFSNGFLVLQA